MTECLSECDVVGAEGSCYFVSLQCSSRFIQTGRRLLRETKHLIKTDATLKDSNPRRGSSECIVQPIAPRVLYPLVTM